jgi:hypothetical protein
MKDQEATALDVARAVADQQVAHIDTTLDELLLPDVRRLLTEGAATDAWARMSLKLFEQLGDRPDFLAELLTRLAVRYCRQLP